MKLPSLEPGKLYRIHWWDIVEDSRGNPAESQPRMFKHSYRFFGIRTAMDERKRMIFYVWTTGEPPDYYHSLCIPAGCITHIEPLEGIK